MIGIPPSLVAALRLAARGFLARNEPEPALETPRRKASVESTDLGPLARSCLCEWDGGGSAPRAAGALPEATR